jgi:hypothetical protein
MLFDLHGQYRYVGTGRRKRLWRAEQYIRPEN